MKTMAALLILVFASVLPAASFAQGKEAPPECAYPVNPPGLKPPPGDGTLRHVPGSTAAFTLTRVRDRQFSPVCHPDEHPPQPEEKLTVDDMLVLAAYLASLAP